MVLKKKKLQSLMVLKKSIEPDGTEKAWCLMVFDFDCFAAFSLYNQ